MCEGAGMGTLTPWVRPHLWTLACAFVLASWPTAAPAAPNALPLALFPLLFLLLKDLHKGPTQQWPVLCSVPLIMPSPSQHMYVGPRMSAVHALRPQARALRTLLKMQCQDGLMHESVHVDDLGQCSRKWFEVGRVVIMLWLRPAACCCWRKSHVFAAVH